MPMTREDYRKKFLEFDKSGDGKLTVQELQDHLSHLLRVHVSLQAAQVVILRSQNKQHGSKIKFKFWAKFEPSLGAFFFCYQSDHEDFVTMHHPNEPHIYIPYFSDRGQYQCPESQLTACSFACTRLVES